MAWTSTNDAWKTVMLPYCAWHAFRLCERPTTGPCSVKDDKHWVSPIKQAVAPRVVTHDSCTAFPRFCADDKLIRTQCHLQDHCLSHMWHAPHFIAMDHTSCHLLVSAPE
jgi:hypothetical protein